MITKSRNERHNTSLKHHTEISFEYRVSITTIQSLSGTNTYRDIQMDLRHQMFIFPTKYWCSPRFIPTKISPSCIPANLLSNYLTTIAGKTRQLQSLILSCFINQLQTGFYLSQGKDSSMPEKTSLIKPIQGSNSSIFDSKSKFEGRV